MDLKEKLTEILSKVQDYGMKNDTKNGLIVHTGNSSVAEALIANGVTVQDEERAKTLGRMMAKEAIAELEKLCQEEYGVSSNRLSELVKAEAEGRLVVLPCEVGDTVYRIDSGNYHSNWKPFVHPIVVDEISWKYAHTMKGKKDLGFAIIANGSRYKLSSIGKTVFLTREEAEKVLEVGNGNA